MSLFHMITVDCPSCGETVRVSAVGSVNADRRPDYRDAILDNNFQDTTCGSCEESFRLQPEFNYLDAARGQWIAAMPAAGYPDYLKIEDHVTDLFAKSYGDKAPAAAQAVGKNLGVRVTFGWPAVREKLLLAGYDMDDVALELMKLDLFRKLPSAPVKPGVELRLDAIDNDVMTFIWLKTLDEEMIEHFATPLGWYQSIADNPEPWNAAREELVDGAFVDFQKVYIGEGRHAAE